MANNNLAYAFKLHQAGRLEEAEAHYAAHLAAHPTDPSALNNAAALALQTGDIELALARFETLVRVAPPQAHVYSNLGYALLQAGRSVEAIAQLERAVDMDPMYAVAYNNLGMAYERDDRRSEAIASFERAVALKPDYADAAANLGEVLNRDDETARARVSLKQALAAQPDHLGARVALAASDALDGGLNDARAALEALAPSQPHYSKFWQVLAMLRTWEGDLDAAEPATQRAAALDPNDPQAKFGVASALLARGDYSRGWRAFEERRDGCYGKSSRLGEFPMWDGADTYSTLLVYCEQGLGDVVQFARFIPQARRRVRRLIFLADAAWKCLEPLLASLAGIDRIYTDRLELIACEDRPLVRTSALSLPYLLGIDVAALPGIALPYLFAPADRVKRWAPRLDAISRPRVGLAWAAAVRRDIRSLTRHKAIPVAELPTLIGVPGINFVSLQIGAGSSLALLGAPWNRLIDFTSDISDFGDTAAIMSDLDLIVSTDTSVAHVAGAMGKPVWMIDRFNTCWRWRLADDSSPWYPTMRIFRQVRFGDWSEPLARVAVELSKLT